MVDFPIIYYSEDLFLYIFSIWFEIFHLEPGFHRVCTCSTRTVQYQRCRELRLFSEKKSLNSNISWYKLTISLSWHTKWLVDVLVLGIGTYLTPYKQNELVPAEFWSCLYFRHFSSVKNGFEGSYYGKSWSVPCEIYTMTGGVMMILNVSDFSHACVHAYMCHTCPSTLHGMLFQRTQYCIYAIHFLVL